VAEHRSAMHLTTADGLRLEARWWPATGGPASAVVVVVHGFSAGQDDAGVGSLASDLAGAGYDVLTYDARGHGASEGWSGVGSVEHLDVASAVDAVRDRRAPVVLVGISMGGVAVVGYLTDLGAEVLDVVSGAVLVSTPARWRMRASPVGLLTAVLTRTRTGRWVASRRMRVRVSPEWHVGEPLESMVARIDVPLAVVHGTGDRMLAEEHGHLLHASAGGPSRLDLIEGMRHGIDRLSREATVAAVSWVLNLSRQAPDRASVT